MDPKDTDDQHSPTETERRYKDALKRMLSTPHQPHKPIGKKSRPNVKRSSSAAKPK